MSLYEILLILNSFLFEISLDSDPIVFIFRIGEQPVDKDGGDVLVPQLSQCFKLLKLVHAGKEGGDIAESS